jgi:Ca2+/Na+ antiporter
MRNKVKTENNKDKDSKESEVWRRSKWLSISSMVLLAVSALVSCIFRYPAIVIIAFVLAVAAYIFSTVRFNKDVAEVDKEIAERISKREKKCEEYLSNYSENYSRLMLKLLNDKLDSLGLKQVSDEEGI